MKINEVTVDRRPGYAKQDTPVTTKYAAIGNHLQNYAGNMPMGKGVSDEQIRLSTNIGRLGEALIELNTPGGPKSIEDVIKRSGLSREEVAKYVKFGEELYQKFGDTRQQGASANEPEDDEEDYGSPSDDAIARQADARAAKRK